MEDAVLLSILLSALSPAFAGSAPWEERWEKIPAKELPALTPDGSLEDFRLALSRQTENCDDYAAGEFRHCRNETIPVQLECDRPTLEKLSKLAREATTWKAFYRRARRELDWYRYRAPAEGVLYTGYNSPLFTASLSQEGEFQHPAYNRPPDLVNVHGPNGESLWRKQLPDGSLVPYDDRKAIDVDKALAGKGLETAWFDHPADLMRLHIEGSGVLEARGPDGAKVKYGINFAGKNGLPYVSVFKRLKDKGVDKKYLTFPGLKQYFQDFPDEMWPTLTSNPSYVFFSVGQEPPCGTARVHVTGGHSLATDPTHMPLGLVGLVQAQRPVEGIPPEQPNVPTQPFTRFAIAQDTGSAIKEAHVDIYWGTGDYAQLASNTMKSKGALFLPKAKQRRDRGK